MIGGLLGLGQAQMMDARQAQINQFESDRQMLSMRALAGIRSFEPEINVVVDKKFDSIKDELQDEVDEWLKDTI